MASTRPDNVCWCWARVGQAAVVYGLADAGAARIVILNRTLGHAADLVAALQPLFAECPLAAGWLPDELGQWSADTDLIVNCTSLGMTPHVDTTPWDDSVALCAGQVVYDLVYNPPVTRLLQQAEHAGARAVGGLGMLIWQGALAFERWTGQPAPVDIMRVAALRQMNGTRMNTDEHGSGQSESAFIRVHPRSISVRRATPEDAADIPRLNADVQRIHAAAHPDFFKPPSATTFPPAHFVELMERPDTVMFVAESEGRIVGYLYGDVTPAMETSSTYAFPRFYIHHISVEPAHQGQGCGTALIEAAKAVARERGIPTLALSVWDFNHKAHAFFARHGFVDYNQRMWIKGDLGARGEGRGATPTEPQA